jgi:surface antigen/acyl dehydratase
MVTRRSGCQHSSSTYPGPVRPVAGQLQRLAVALTAALIVVAGGSASAEGAEPAPVLDLATPTVAQSGHATLAIDAHQPAYCVLRFSGPRRTAAGPFSVRSRYARIRWDWKVGSHARTGNWVATARCATAVSNIARAATLKQRYKVVATAGGRNPGLLPSDRRLFVARGSLRASTSRTAALGRPAKSLGVGTDVGLGSSGNPFACPSPSCVGWSYWPDRQSHPDGQCTYYAYDRRPDIWAAARTAGVATNHWNAYLWADNARAGGMRVGTTPAIGAIAVFPIGYGGSSVGHVAYVEAVNGDGSYVVSEHNWNHNWTTTTRRAAPYPGVQFIYGGSAADATPSTPLTPGTPSPNSGPSGPSNGSATPQRFRVSDFDGDGRSDIAWYEAATGNATILHGDANGYFSNLGARIVGFGKPDWAGVGDFDGDGRSDIAWYEAATGNATILHSDANGYFSNLGARIVGFGKPDWAGGTGSFSATNGSGATAGS